MRDARKEGGDRGEGMRERGMVTQAQRETEKKRQTKTVRDTQTETVMEKSRENQTDLGDV